MTADKVGRFSCSRCAARGGGRWRGKDKDWPPCDSLFRAEKKSASLFFASDYFALEPGHTLTLFHTATQTTHSHSATNSGDVSEAFPSFGFIQLETNGCSQPERCHFSKGLLFHVVLWRKFILSVTTSRGHHSVCTL